MNSWEGNPDRHAITATLGSGRRSVLVYVENGVSRAHDVGSAAWLFDLDLWGVCGQGTDEGAALRDLQRILGRRAMLEVAERLGGNERAFTRDLRPCTQRERRVTQEILDQTRRQTLLLLGSCTEGQLDSNDHNQSVLSIARWPTLRQMGWQIAERDCRYLLPAAGLPSKSRVTDLFQELTEGAEHVRSWVRDVPADLAIEREGQVWTSVKLLRRLAWHERNTLALMRATLTLLRRVALTPGVTSAAPSRAHAMTPKGLLREAGNVGVLSPELDRAYDERGYLQDGTGNN